MLDCKNSTAGQGGLESSSFRERRQRAGATSTTVTGTSSGIFSAISRVAYDPMECPINIIGDGVASFVSELSVVSSFLLLFKIWIPISDEEFGFTAPRCQVDQ